MKGLNLIAPNHLTRVTSFIQEQIEIIDTLTAKGCTYETSDGIYFDTFQISLCGNGLLTKMEKARYGMEVPR